MKTAVCGIILAMTLAPITFADQGQSKPKEKTTQSKGQAKGKTKQGVGTAGAGGAAVQSCSPDTTAPVIQSVSATPKVLTVPNHRMTPITLSVNVTDNCPGSVTWAVTGVTSDEPLNGTGDGDTEPDWEIPSAHAVRLRSERAGTGDGRIYTITITARDAANNTATGTTTVTVPHNR
jgi:hypothetical protein